MFTKKRNKGVPMKHLRLSVVSTMGIAMVLFAVGCTKKRDAKAPEALSRNLFEISEFSGTDYNLKTDSKMKALSWSESAKVGNEKGRVQVISDSSNVPERLKFMVQDLDISGQPNQDVKMHLEIDSENVTAYKIVNNVDELSAIEKQAVVIGKDRTQIKVPMFQFKVEGYGVLSRVKNELGEETSTLELKPTDWKNATHVQVSTNSDNRIMLGIPNANIDDKETTFLISKLDNKVVTAGQLRDEFQVKIGAIDEKAKVLTRLDSNGLHVYEITSKSKLNEKEKQILARVDKLGVGGRVEECSSELKKLVEKDNIQDCVITVREHVPVRFVKSELVKSDKSQSVAVKLSEARYSKDTTLVQIPQNAEPRMEIGEGSTDIRDAVKISDLKDKEFLLRRTFEDGSQSVMFAPGMSGDTKLVRFEFEDKRLVVRTTKEQYEGRNTGKIDRSELMSFPVQYFKLLRKDSAGADLAIPQTQTTEKEDAEFILIDWSHNTIPNLNSPLSFYADGSCLISNGTQTVSDLDMRFKEGVLNFTITGSYTLSPDRACVKFIDVNDYFWSDPKMTTNVKERISFKLNDGSKNQAYVNEIPFDAQNAMNFGLFTMANLKPSEQGGLLGREGNEISHPLVFDIRNGKKIVYYAGGLPDDAKRKEIIIEATKQSIDYWNKALKIAFKGTQLERNDDYIELRIDDGTQFPKGHLGDLDRNYIWYMDRYLEEGPLGVAQPAPNPNSGILESANVIMYSGNSAMEIEYLQRISKTMTEYDTMIAKFKSNALADLKKKEEAEKLDASKSIINDGVIAPQNVGAGNKIRSKVAATIKSITRNNRKTVKAQLNWKPSLNAQSIFSASGQITKLTKNDFTNQLKKNVSVNSLYSNIMKRILDQNITADDQVESIIIDEFLKSNALVISAEQRRVLEARSKLTNYKGDFMARINHRPGCVRYASDNMMLRNDNIAKYANGDFDEILKEELVGTLTHELGHTLGLTHNFKGSYDKANFNFEGQKTDRNYSSIMDYMAGYDQVGADPGPYDIHALRAAYTGLVEVDSSKITKNNNGQNVIKIAKADKSSVEIPVLNDNDVKILDVKKAIGAENSWLKFNTNTLRQVPLKKYEYCTDKHLRDDPTCQQFDVGTSAEEISENLIKDYKSQYMYMNYAGNRLNFNWSNKVGLYQRHISKFLKMRQFMDELFYKLITRDIKSQEELMSYFQASLKTMLFFNEIVRTPTEALGATDANRFKAVAYEYPEMNEKGEATGKMLKDIDVVEVKSLEDISDSIYRINTLGIEIDKVIATQLLTLRGLPQSKYSANNINFSYLDFEKFILQVKNPAQSPTTNLLLEMNANKVTPVLFTTHGTMEPLTSGFKADLNSWLRIQTAISSVLDLESLSIFSDYNYANLFKVGSSIGKAPADKISVAKLGIDPKSSTRVEYYALDNATVASEIVRQAKVLGYFLSADSSMVAATSDLVKVQLSIIAELNKLKMSYQDLDKAIAKNSAIKTLVDKSNTELVKLTTLLTEMNKTKLILPDEALKQGVTIEQIASVIRDYMTDQLETASDISVFMTNGDVPPSLSQLTDMIKKSNSEQAEANPLMALVQRVLKQVTAADKNLGAAMGELVDGSETKVNYSLLLANIEILNKFTLMTNPEYNR